MCGCYVWWSLVVLLLLLCNGNRLNYVHFSVESTRQNFTGLLCCCLVVVQTPNPHTQPFGTCWILQNKSMRSVCCFDFLECVTLAGFGTLAFLCFCALNG